MINNTCDNHNGGVSKHVYPTQGLYRVFPYMDKVFSTLVFANKMPTPGIDYYILGVQFQVPYWVSVVLLSTAYYHKSATHITTSI